MPDFFPGDPPTRGWDFGMAGVTGWDSPAATPTRVGWAVGISVPFYVQLVEGLARVLMVQREVARPPVIERDFWTTVYATIGG